MNRRLGNFLSLSFVASSLLLSLGCSGSSDREPLQALMETLAEAAKNDYQGEIKSHPREEWAVRRGILTTSRDLKVIDDFLRKKPKLSVPGQAAIESLRQIIQKHSDFFEGIAKTGRFNLTDLEKEKYSEMIHDRLLKAKEIGRLIDGDSN